MREGYCSIDRGDRLPFTRKGARNQHRTRRSARTRKKNLAADRAISLARRDQGREPLRFLLSGSHKRNRVAYGTGDLSNRDQSRLTTLTVAMGLIVAMGLFGGIAILGLFRRSTRFRMELASATVAATFGTDARVGSRKYRSTSSGVLRVSSRCSRKKATPIALKSASTPLSAMAKPLRGLDGEEGGTAISTIDTLVV